MSEPSWTISRKSMEIATAAAMAAFGGVIVFGATRHGIGWTDEGPASGYFPFYSGLALVGASIALLLQLIFRSGPPGVFLGAVEARRAGGFFLGIVGAVAGAFLVGFYLTMLFFIPAIIMASGRSNPIKAISIGVVVTMFFFVFFEIWLRSPLMKGPLEPLLGFY